MEKRWIEVQFYYFVKMLYIKYNGLQAIEATANLLKPSEGSDRILALTYDILTDKNKAPDAREVSRLHGLYGQVTYNVLAKTIGLHRNTLYYYRQQEKEREDYFMTFYSDEDRDIMTLYLKKVQELGGLIL